MTSWLYARYDWTEEETETLYFYPPQSDNLRVEIFQEFWNVNLIAFNWNTCNYNLYPIVSHFLKYHFYFVENSWKLSYCFTLFCIPFTRRWERVCLCVCWDNKLCSCLWLTRFLTSELTALAIGCYWSKCFVGKLSCLAVSSYVLLVLCCAVRMDVSMKVELCLSAVQTLASNCAGSGFL